MGFGAWGVWGSGVQGLQSLEFRVEGEVGWGLGLQSRLAGPTSPLSLR